MTSYKILGISENLKTIFDILQSLITFIINTKNFVLLDLKMETTSDSRRILRTFWTRTYELFFVLHPLILFGCRRHRRGGVPLVSRRRGRCARSGGEGGFTVFELYNPLSDIWMRSCRVWCHSTSHSPYCLFFVLMSDSQKTKSMVVFW